MKGFCAFVLCCFVMGIATCLIMLAYAAIE
jgi:hypothetical protein